MKRLADYVIELLIEKNIKTVFLVTGGAAMHLNDAIGKNSKIRYVCHHHEQACAIAAEGYFRASGRMAAVQVTAGPGAINALNGVFGAWTDSIPMIVISGQSKRETLLKTYDLTGKLRQLGDQEVDIIPMVKGITKYAASINEPKTIGYHIEKAVFLAKSGRPGPVWIDIPVDVQGSLLDPSSLDPFDDNNKADLFDRAKARDQADNILGKLLEAERPILLGGTGVRLAEADDLFLEFAEKVQIPVATAWTHDLIPSGHPLFVGRQGTIGTRSGNFCVQNADFVLILGSRLCIRQISYNWQSFARAAVTAQVDIDPAELDKPTYRAAIPVHSDARFFLQCLIETAKQKTLPSPKHKKWLDWCQERKRKNPVVLPHQRISEPGRINAYFFVEQLFQVAEADHIFVCGDATACITPFQAGYLKKGQRMFSNSGCASMGYDLPAAIGACIAEPSRRIICLAGDGSLSMNVQELATMAHHQLNLKLFIFENGGYASIRATQDNFFKLRIGEGPKSGLSFPNFVKLAQAYGLPASELSTCNVKSEIDNILKNQGPQVILVPLDRNQTFEPKTSSRRLPDGTMATAPLEDMAPFLDRKEFLSNMIIK